ncbi:MAG: hypothetical protein F4Z28_12840, partial [Gammaproteobacteria bacterium]|nr:hypothetical protein [Gammaproteobacteria bacterium]
MLQIEVEATIVAVVATTGKRGSSPSPRLGILARRHLTEGDPVALLGTVHYEVRDGVALLTIDNPPVNPLSSGVRFY